MGVEEIGIKFYEFSFKLANTKGDRKGILRADIKSDVLSAVIFNLASQLPSTGNDRGLMPVFNEFPVEAKDDDFDATLVEFGDELDCMHENDFKRLGLWN